MYALRLKHIQDIILDEKVRFVNFSVYWKGYKLRDLNFDFAPLSVQHSDLLSPFYKKYFKVLNIFKDKCSDSVLGQHGTTSLHNLLLDIDLI